MWTCSQISFCGLFNNTLVRYDCHWATKGKPAFVGLWLDYLFCVTRYVYDKCFLVRCLAIIMFVFIMHKSEDFSTYVDRLYDIYDRFTIGRPHLVLYISYVTVIHQRSLQKNKSEILRFQWLPSTEEIKSPILLQKVNCTVVQALRLCTGRTARRRSRGIALL